MACAARMARRWMSSSSDTAPTFDRIVLPYVENLKQLGVNARYNRVDPAQYRRASAISTGT